MLNYSILPITNPTLACDDEFPYRFLQPACNFYYFIFLLIYFCFFLFALHAKNRESLAFEHTVSLPYMLEIEERIIFITIIYDYLLRYD
jgi:hypothetical protein